jgi:hypothetical protein
LTALETTDPLGVISTWANFGVLGLVVLSLITGWLWTKPSVDRLEAEKDRVTAEKEKAEAQRDAMASVLQERLLPVVGDFINTTRNLLPILQQLQQLQQMIPILQQMIRQQEMQLQQQALRAGLELQLHHEQLDQQGGDDRDRRRGRPGQQPDSS